MSLSLYELKAWQTVEIDGAAYTVKGMIEFRQGTFFWKDYLLETPSRKQYRLGVERDGQIMTCSLFQELEVAWPTGTDLVYEGRHYALTETGSAEVQDFFGMSGVTVGDVVEFGEYRDEEGGLLSREQWKDSVRCASGIEILKTSITVDSVAFADLPAAPLRGSPALSWEKMSSLSPGQELEIRGQKYCVMGQVRNRQNEFQWVEYDIEPELGESVWLSVERVADGSCALSLHRSIPFSLVRLQDGGASVLWDNKTYERTEQGTAVVTGYSGRGDYDHNERFTFIEYRSQFGEILTCEYWSDEQEASLGRELPFSDLKILNSRKLSVAVGGGTGLRISFSVVFLVTVLIVMIAPHVYSLFNMTPLIEKQLASRSSFRRLTSVTLNDGRKAQVYSTPLSADAACRAIIAMDPERIRFVTTTTEETASGEEAERMLQTSRESVMIYTSEDGTTCVQVVAEKGGDDERPYTAYRARNPFRLGRLYSSSRNWSAPGRSQTTRTTAYSIDTGKYTSVVAGARQASVAARRASGGGIGFGK